MATDGVISIVDSRDEDLERFAQMECDEDTQRFIIPYSAQKHRAEFHKADVIYKSIYGPNDHLIGFIILAVDDAEKTAEFRRVVVAEKNKGYGKRAVRLVDRICQEEFQAEQVWLDVFDFNQRGQHIYENAGYHHVKDTEFEGQTLKIYEKNLESHGG